MQNIFTLKFVQVLVYLFQILLVCPEPPLQNLWASGRSWDIVKEVDQTIDWNTSLRKNKTRQFATVKTLQQTTYRANYKYRIYTLQCLNLACNFLCL